MPNAPAPKMIFVNLPVKDLAASLAFYEAVGAVPNEDFCDDSTKTLNFSDTIYVMLMTRERFSSFTSRSIHRHATSASEPTPKVKATCPRPS